MTGKRSLDRAAPGTPKPGSSSARKTKKEDSPPQKKNLTETQAQKIVRTKVEDEARTTAASPDEKVLTSGGGGKGRAEKLVCQLEGCGGFSNKSQIGGHTSYCQERTVEERGTAKVKRQGKERKKELLKGKEEEREEIAIGVPDMEEIGGGAFPRRWKPYEAAGEGDAGDEETHEGGFRGEEG